MAPPSPADRPAAASKTEPAQPESAQPETKPKRTPSESSEQDRATVLRALDGDQRAFQELHQKYERALFHHVLRLVKKSEWVDDLVQEAFIKAFKALSSYSPAYAFSTWLYKIATNHTIDFLRKRRLKTYSLDKPLQTKDGEMEMQVPDETYRPDRAIVEDQRRTLIQEAIDQLPPKYNRVIVMRHQQDKAYQEIADELALPLGTVKAHIFRARELLNKYLRDKRDQM